MHPDRIQSKIANHWTDGRHHGNFSDLSFAILLRCSAENPLELFAHDTLSPSDKKHVDLIAKENLVQPNLFNKLGPFEFLFLDKEKKSVAKNFDEKI